MLDRSVSFTARVLAATRPASLICSPLATLEWGRDWVPAGQ
jgi:hypothetical protein